MSAMRFRHKRAFKLFAVLALVSLVFVAVSAWPRSTEVSSPVPVRFEEGVFHGFLILRSEDGGALAFGDLRQVGTGGEIKNHMSFRFKDGSILDETVTFTQDRVFTMRTYHTVHRGPAFPEDLEATLDRSSGKYRVKTKDRADGKDKEIEGTLVLPANVYNGMILTVLKNLGKSSDDTIHLITFTPKPEIVKLELTQAGQQTIFIAGVPKRANAYTLHPNLDGARKLLAMLAGRVPPDGQIMVLADEVPTFLRFRGQLFMDGPIWRIELTSPEPEGRRAMER
jgi:hypothetical protein